MIFIRHAIHSGTKFSETEWHGVKEAALSASNRVGVRVCEAKKSDSIREPAARQFSGGKLKPTACLRLDRSL